MTRRRRRLLLASGAVAAAATAAALAFLALGSSVSYFYTPSELAANGVPERAIRLGGLVENGSLGHDALDPAIVTFVVTDGEARTPVRYRGILPDLFREGQGVVAQGRIGADGTLAADTVLAKHDENYMPKEVADALKAQGRWRDGGLAPPSQE
jgi:cytochrome c-type biogenesis protein CcmE